MSLDKLSEKILDLSNKNIKDEGETTGYVWQRTLNVFWGIKKDHSPIFLNIGNKDKIFEESSFEKIFHFNPIEKILVKIFGVSIDIKIIDEIKGTQQEINEKFRKQY